MTFRQLRCRWRLTWHKYSGSLVMCANNKRTHSLWPRNVLARNSSKEITENCFVCSWVPLGSIWGVLWGNAKWSLQMTRGLKREVAVSMVSTGHVRERRLAQQPQVSCSRSRRSGVTEPGRTPRCGGPQRLCSALERSIYMVGVRWRQGVRACVCNSGQKQVFHS